MSYQSGEQYIYRYIKSRIKQRDNEGKKSNKQTGQILHYKKPHQKYHREKQKKSYARRIRKNATKEVSIV